MHGMLSSRDLEWDDVRCFLAVNRTGTLAAAARKLRINYTTVGRRIAALQRALGARLFDRTPDGLVLTDAGEAVRTAGDQMEEAALLFEQRALGADRTLSGLVRVATTEAIGQVVFLPALRALHEKHPHIRVELLTGSLQVDIARREADLAVRYIRPEGGNLVTRRIARVGTAAYASRGYLRRHQRPVQGSGLTGHDLVGLDQSIRSDRSMELAGEQLRDARFVLRVMNTVALCEAVAQGLGLGALPCCLGDVHPALVRLWPDAPPELDDLWLVLHSDLQRTGRVRAVLDALSAQFALLAPRLSGSSVAPRSARTRPSRRKR